MSQDQRLYEAIVTIRMAVLGENGKHAKQRALSNASQEEPESVTVRLVNDLLDLPVEFHDSLPWGSDEQTVREILE